MWSYHRNMRLMRERQESTPRERCKEKTHSARNAAATWGKYSVLAPSEVPCRIESVDTNFLFEHLVPTGVSLVAGEGGSEPFFDCRLSLSFGEKSSAERQYIGIIVIPRRGDHVYLFAVGVNLRAGGLTVIHHGAHAFDAIGGKCFTLARTPHDDAPTVVRIFCNLPRRRLNKYRIIILHIHHKCAAIFRFVSKRSHKLDQCIFERKASVIGCQVHLHNH